MMCRVLKVSRSSYYYWLREPKSERKEQVKVLKEKIQTAYFKAKGRYGSPESKKNYVGLAQRCQDQQLLNI